MVHTVELRNEFKSTDFFHARFVIGVFYRFFRHTAYSCTGLDMAAFYARQLYRQVLLRARISYGNSVCPSVCLSVTTRWYTKHRRDRDPGSSPYGSLEYLVSYEVVWCQWVKRFPSNGGHQRGVPP